MIQKRKLMMDVNGSRQILNVSAVFFSSNSMIYNMLKFRRGGKIREPNCTNSVDLMWPVFFHCRYSPRNLSVPLTLLAFLLVITKVREPFLSFIEMRLPLFSLSYMLIKHLLLFSSAESEVYASCNYELKSNTWNWQSLRNFIGATPNHQ